MRIVEKHKDYVVPYDLIWFHGKIRSVCVKDIKYSKFIGKTIFGDSFSLGRKKVLSVEGFDNNEEQEFIEKLVKKEKK